MKSKNKQNQNILQPGKFQFYSSIFRMAGHGSGSGEPRAPDGGWGWVVCFGAFMLQALTLGVTYTFGILFVELLDFFESGQAETAWIGSIQPCLLYFTGIVGGPLLLHYGWRVVAISGAILSSAGFVASAFAPKLWVLYFTYGVMTGACLLATYFLVPCTDNHVTC